MSVYVARQTKNWIDLENPINRIEASEIEIIRILFAFNILFNEFFGRRKYLNKLNFKSLQSFWFGRLDSSPNLLQNRYNVFTENENQ